MPVIPIPCEYGSAVVLTDMCLVITSEGVYDHPCQLGKRAVILTPAEFSACNWRRVVNTRYGLSGIGRMEINIRVSIYGVDLRERVCGVRNICMSYQSSDCFKSLKALQRLSPRLAWLGKYARIKEHRTALAMANHPRLGGASALSCLGDDVMRILIGMM